MQEITGKVGEAILLGDHIQLIILNIEGSQARIGLRDMTGKPLTETQLLESDADDDSTLYGNAPLISGNLLSENRSQHQKLKTG